MIVVSGFMILLITFIFLSTRSNEKRTEERQRITAFEELQERNRIDPATNLTQVQLKVLDTYERSNIRIPVDIIEDLTAHRINNESDIAAFIENQRHYWKLENSKKPYKGDY